MSRAWSAETEARVLDVLKGFAYDGGIPGANFNSNDADRATESVLEALADAGLLLPPGGVRFEQRGWEMRGGEVTANPSVLLRTKPHTHVRLVTCWDPGMVLEEPWRPVAASHPSAAAPAGADSPGLSSAPTHAAPGVGETGGVDAPMSAPP